jgi:hypothetical protein
MILCSLAFSFWMGFDAMSTSKMSFANERLKYVSQLRPKLRKLDNYQLYIPCFPAEFKNVCIANPATLWRKLLKGGPSFSSLQLFFLFFEQILVSISHGREAEFFLEVPGEVTPISKANLMQHLFQIEECYFQKLSGAQ